MTARTMTNNVKKQNNAAGYAMKITLLIVTGVLPVTFVVSHRNAINGRSPLFGWVW